MVKPRLDNTIAPPKTMAIRKLTAVRGRKLRDECRAL
ncbi:hypothetical protein SM11_chr0117 [Sinorhizobium meliloti SM11]|uniref:Uncharacterized protein n=1 Tax=Sinorhizobium meliloti (strain SM11) TaxID=707241 RepID=F7X6J8_SINMM|nr:hypothetical protein SM11_chr0117 [Sinorhizobium meliloti SM11]